MAFEEIENAKPVKAVNAGPRDGVVVTARELKRGSGALVRFIRVVIGADLAAKAALTQNQQGLRMLFGKGDDAGQIMIAVDNEKGRFLAKRNAQGCYVTTINAATAEGRFALEFPTFAVPQLEVKRAPGCPPAFTFAASAEMLAAKG